MNNNKVGKFEKVSFEEFSKSLFENYMYTEEDSKKIYENIMLPTRATTGSAGYDIRSTFSFNLMPAGSIKIPTGIRVKIDEGWFLGCFPKSGLGFKYRLQLDNTIGIVDSDYYFSDNEGHIFLKMTNDTTEDKIIKVSEGDKIAQGVFLPYGITVDDDTQGIRNGGFGSTGK